MPYKLKRKYSHWYQYLFFNPYFQYLVSFLVIIILPACFFWEDLLADSSFHGKQVNTLAVNSAAFTISFILLYKFKRFPGTRSLPFIIPTLTTTWLTVFALTVFLHITDFERHLMFTSYLTAVCMAFVGFILDRKYNLAKLALAPFGSSLELSESIHADTFLLQEPTLPSCHFDGIVADLHAKDLPREWERFLAECILMGMPVYHSQQVLESITGKVGTEHLSENYFGSLMPSHLYSIIKRVIETSLVLLTAPLWLPLMLITGIIVKLDSEGSMFFVQERVGQGNKDFKVYKLRSMCIDSEKYGAQFAQTNDMRVTRVGKFIRKTRLDEIPQFINVIKGDMSLIGPRPEQRTFVEQFEKIIPFYSYRHVVKPGISGWAQVVHGYAADADDTKVKLAHDFYYIKHFSLWLDILIFIKTIRTILTGFGSR